MTGGIEYRKRRMGVVVQQGELITVPDARILTSRDDERRGGERGSASVFGRLGRSIRSCDACLCFTVTTGQPRGYVVGESLVGGRVPHDGEFTEALRGRRITIL